METFDLTPDPKVLLALTHTPMQPMDALCELIDNAIDSFSSAKVQGKTVEQPLVIIDLPKLSKVNDGTGAICIRDNGPGMNRGDAERALRAGFSGNNPYDSLGLFGMGFNISTGKLGRVTRMMTARKDDSAAIQVTVDLENIRQSRSFRVPVEAVDKPQDFQSGTLVEIAAWWPEGNPNSGFVRKLVQYGMPRVRQEVGRRYATLLREHNIRIIINGEQCEPFEHCHWKDARSVERRGLGTVPAVLRFNQVIGSQVRCGVCAGLVEPGTTICQVKACGSSHLRTIEERVRGWVGIQRFDDPTEFGIDLIRNGRAIRIGEKTAFFEFIDEFKRVMKDYPIDSPYGRIVGEVHLNHVPVDFLKQDFQRSSPEWLKAMTFLRGDSSLQPTQPGADRNASPIYRLYQGYRRVRNFGRGDMYMGVWDAASGSARRISRDVEQEYYKKFLKRVPGWYDDSEWWKLVEQADRKPLDELVECHGCSAQNLKGHEVCIACGAVLIGKSCASAECLETIPISAASCPHCGRSQVPEIMDPWRCLVCEVANPPEAAACMACAATRGTMNPLSLDRLLASSNKSDELSIPVCTVALADGAITSPLVVQTYCMREPIVPRPGVASIPLFAIKTPEQVDIFVDLSHLLFKSFRVRPEQMIAAEVALVVYDANRRLSGGQFEGMHTLSTLSGQILQGHWRSTLEETSEKLRLDINGFLAGMRERLPSVLAGHFDDVYDDLDETQQKQMYDNMISGGMDLIKLADMRRTGQYLRFIGESAMISIFKDHSAAFFDGKFWDDAWIGGSGLPGVVVEDAQNRTRSIYLNCLEDIVVFLRLRDPDAVVMQRARASLQLLIQKIS